jgi:hypothetical protein
MSKSKYSGYKRILMAIEHVVEGVK